MDRAAYIVDGVRTPIGAIGGSLSSVRPDDMAASVISELVKRHPEMQQSEIADVILGCANQAGEDNRNVARMAALLAGLPHTVPAETINRLCASGMSAVINGSRMLHCGDGDVVICGGVESMTRAPYVLSKSSAPYGRDVKLYDTSFGWRFVNPKMEAMYGCDSMGQTAENLAKLWEVSRTDQDLFAYASQMKTRQAQQSGRLAKEIMPLEISVSKQTVVRVERDEFPKPDTTPEILSQLKPAFDKDGTVTAGNASGLNDGAAALLLASETAIRKYGWRPLAKIIASAVVGVEPRIMGIGPVGASQKALAKAALRLDQMGVIEINEAFAAQVLACTRALHLADDDPRVNPNGGAIALGHPLGMSGARISYSAALELHLTGKRYALVTMCVGVGQGYALVLENPNA